MKDSLRFLIIILILPITQSCTVANYHLRDALSNNDQKHSGICDINFSLILESSYHTNTFGTKNTNHKELTEIKNKYITSTIDALHDIGCNAIHTENTESSNFKIHIKRQQSVSALPQEWLTGLSFGLIPSWGTRPEQFLFSFKSINTEKSYIYTVDSKSYNHLILFPIFWVTFFIADEYSTFQKAITNFVKKS